MSALEPRLAQILAEPPLVHGVYDADGTLTGHGVWHTDTSCYEVIAGSVHAGMRTLETGLGVSTALFAALATDHTCVTYGQDEVDRLLAYCAARDIDMQGVTFHVGDSARILPALDLADLDLVLIDGGHGFPFPVIDWYHGAGALRPGGLVVIDDLQLPAVAIVSQFLDLDPRWSPVQRTDKWAAYRREAAGPLAEDWWQQPFLTGPVMLNPRPPVEAAVADGRRLIGAAARRAGAAWRRAGAAWRGVAGRRGAR